jgi:hypothetical protein
MFRKLRLGLMLCQHWWAMFRGRSYWHHPQPLGRVFVPGELAGYFSDMTHKAHWDGPVDATHGIPLITNDAGEVVIFPITAFQKALGHWDLWLLSNKQDCRQLEAFQAIVAWALAGQDERGAWPTWNLLSADMTRPYSAMSQGEGLSVLARAWTVTGDEALLAAAARAEALMLTDLADGGVSWRSEQGLVLEEKPLSPPGTILNGWIYSLFGLHDLALVAPAEQRKAVLADTVAALAAWLDRFDTGAWSRYDLHGNLASPFYHTVHVAQLQALELTYGHRHEEFATFRERWQRWDRSRLHRWRAVGRKGWQKLRRPPAHFMR